MEMKLKLYKKEGTYFNEKDKKDKPFTNFYIACNDELIPVEVKYFPNPALQNRDPGYAARFAVLRAFAETLPEKEDKKEKVNPKNVVCPKCGEKMRIDDKDETDRKGVYHYYLACDKCGTTGFIDGASGTVDFVDGETSSENK